MTVWDVVPREGTCELETVECLGIETGQQERLILPKINFAFVRYLRSFIAEFFMTSINCYFAFS